MFLTLIELVFLFVNISVINKDFYGQVKSFGWLFFNWQGMWDYVQMKYSVTIDKHTSFRWGAFNFLTVREIFQACRAMKDTPDLRLTIMPQLILLRAFIWSLIAIYSTSQSDFCFKNWIKLQSNSDRTAKAKIQRNTHRQKGVDSDSLFAVTIKPGRDISI